MTDLLIVAGGISGVVALFFVADWVWAGRLKKRLQKNPNSSLPGTYDATSDTSTNYAVMQNNSNHLSENF
jgi:hypothetical protein